MAATTNYGGRVTVTLEGYGRLDGSLDTNYTGVFAADPAPVSVRVGVGADSIDVAVTVLEDNAETLPPPRPMPGCHAPDGATEPDADSIHRCSGHRHRGAEPRGGGNE